MFACRLGGRSSRRPSRPPGRLRFIAWRICCSASTRRFARGVVGWTGVVSLTHPPARIGNFLHENEIFVLSAKKFQITDCP